MQPRSKSESHPTKLESQESYEYMSHKGVPEGQKDLYDDSIETLKRYGAVSCMYYVRKGIVWPH